MYMSASGASSNDDSAAGNVFINIAGFAKLWDLIDVIQCITLRTRPERAEAARRQFARVGLADRVHFLVMEPDADDGKRGCFHSHQHAARRALELGAKHALTFEDDVEFTNDFSPFAAARAAKFLSETDEPWELFFLGHFPRKMELTSQRDVVKVRSMDGHAYVLTAQGMRALGALAYRGDQVDVHYHYCCAQAFALYPMVALQRASFSDTEAVERAADWNGDKLAREQQLYKGAVGRQLLGAALPGLVS
jgi:hypothetical protein